MGGFAWVTLATNDSYSLGALVLGHALKQAGTIGQLVVLVTPGVTPSMRAKLSAVFNVVQEVNILDSKDEANLRLLKRPELGVTFTKLHCWRLTQFDKCVFLDADTLILSNCDELFQREEFSAAPDVGWPDCFNSGVFVFKPSNDTYESLIKFALEHGSFDGGDQGLLNLFFSDWAHKDINKRLPFIYNMCSVASYSYLPAFKQYGGQVKIVHFIGVTKPWLQYFDTESQQVQPAAGMDHLKQHLQLWWNIFCKQVHPALTPDMEGLASAFAQFTLGSRRSQTQSALEDHLRRQSWEVGNIDYLGRDSFSNIWSKISATMTDSKEGQAQDIARSEPAPIAPPKPISAPETPVCVKPDAVLQQVESPINTTVKQSPEIPIAASQIDGPPVTLKDILQSAQPSTPRETVQLRATAGTISAAACVTKSDQVEVCEAKPAELKDTSVSEAKSSASTAPMALVESIEPANVTLAEGGPVVAGPQVPVSVCEKPVPICEKQVPPAPVCQKAVQICEKTPVVCEKLSTETEVNAPVCQKSLLVCEKATVCQKSAPICEKAAPGREKPVDKAVLIPEPTPGLPPVPAPSPIILHDTSVISTPAVPTAPAAVPLKSPSQEECKSSPLIAVCAKPIEPVLPISETKDKPNVVEQALDKAVSTTVPTEKPQASIPDSPPILQDNGNKNNKTNKKTNKNGKPEGKQQQPKVEKQAEAGKGNNKHTQKEAKASSDVAKTEEKSSTPVPVVPAIPVLPKQESEVKADTPLTPTKEQDTKEETKKPSDGSTATAEPPVTVSTGEKLTQESTKAGNTPVVAAIVQDSKEKKNDKQKKDNAQGDKKVEKPKEQQKSDIKDKGDKKKGADKTEGKKDGAQKLEQQGQGKNGKKGNNKGKKEDVGEKVEQSSESKPEQKVEGKPESAPEQKVVEPKADEKVEKKEKPEGKAQQKPDTKPTNKQGKDGKSDDKRKGVKDQKPQAPSPPKEKVKEQPTAPKQEPTMVASIPPLIPSAQPAIPAVPVPALPTTAAQPEIVKPAAEAPAPESQSSPAQPKQPSGNQKKESAPTPPPRKGNNGGKKGKKK